MHFMDIKALDLNLLRVFDAIWRTRNVSRAAEELGLSQPATSQGLARLRRHLDDALFARTAGGVTPTPRAEQLAIAVQAALGTLEQALSAAERFDPLHTRRVFRLHLSDIGEARFLPALTRMLRAEAPGARVESSPWPVDQIAAALDARRIDAAIGYLRGLDATPSTPLITDRYVVLLRRGHPAARLWRRRQRPPVTDVLNTLDFAAVRSHADTLRILELLGLNERVRLTVANFLSLPMTVKSTDLAVLMPHTVARGIEPAGDFDIIAPEFPLRDFTVSLHWSPRFEHDAAQRWFRSRVVALFGAH